MHWELVLGPIRSDKTSGALELARRAVAALLHWADHYAPVALADWKADLVTFGCALYRTQPAMAPLFNLVNDVLRAVGPATAWSEAQQCVRSSAQAFLQDLENSNDRVIAAALPLVMPARCILTFSYSSTVVGVLLAAHRQGAPLTVLCTESRPMLEGRRLAQRLAAAGISIEFGIDMAIWAFAGQASLALVGADSVTQQGVVNKLGTRGVVEAVRVAGVPCYVLCGRQKWFPAAAPGPDPSHPQPIHEVWSDPPAGVTVWNTYFERTPLELFSAIIGEGGPLAPGELLHHLTTMPVAEALRSASPHSQP